MKKNIIIIVALTIGILLPFSCNKESTVEESLDGTVLQQNIKDKTIEIYNSQYTGINIRPMSVGNQLNMTPAERQQLAALSLSLLKSYGLTEAEINADLNGITEEKLIEVAYSILDIEEQAKKGIQLYDPSDNISFLTGEQLPATDGIQIRPQSDVGTCLLHAIGFAGAYELMRNGITRMSKGAVKKLLIKVASRYLSWVGLAIAVYEFGDCMDWW
ncbi:MAG: hypothetical protein LBS55_06055 [Prevotellaceae bacterium]|jgi:hypothetical protein|nr:hypothetical protein [Prevotellaceae bacterium]